MRVFPSCLLLVAFAAYNAGAEDVAPPPTPGTPDTTPAAGTTRPPPEATPKPPADQGNTTPKEAPPPTPNAADDDLYALGEALFDHFASPEVKAEYAFPSREQWDAFVGRLQQALQNDSLEELAAYEPQVRAAVPQLRQLPGGEAYADWLAERLDLIETARLATQPPPPGRPVPSPAVIPYYDLWYQRLRDRPTPARAAPWLPGLRHAFAAEGVSPDLVWLAEVESAFNPAATSPAGAKGLFQLMPDTAHALGLSTWLPDERTQPAPSARAAARLLRQLHGKFGTWPLALAAYNAGEGRVRRLLAKRSAHTYAEIAPLLPAETRLYVPKVLATVARRTGTVPALLPAPSL